mgnify:FL=1
MNKNELKNYLMEEVGYRESIVNEMDAEELLDAYLRYNGIIGYTDDIIDVMKAAFEDEIIFDSTED